MHVAVNGMPSVSRSTGKVLEVNLLLEILRARGDQHALAAQNRGNQIGEGLAGPGAGFGEQHAAVLEPPRDGVGHFELPGAGLKVGNRARQHAAGREDGVDGVA